MEKECTKQSSGDSDRLSTSFSEKMENDKLEVVTPPSLKRLPNKSRSHGESSPWRRKLLEDCCKRVREERTILLRKMRASTLGSADDKEQIRSTFMEYVSDELKKINGCPSDAPPENLSSSEDLHDMIWEYNGLHDAYPVECEEMLLEMQRIFYEDIKYEENITGNRHETWEDEEDEHLARAVFEHMNLNENEVEITWCPICKQGELVEDKKLILCKNCGLRLYKCDEVNLDKLRTRLGEVHMEHFDKGCSTKPKFCVETEFGLTALYISCSSCSTFEVVI